MSPTRVLVVDDSQAVRGVLTRALDDDPLLTVVGATGNPAEAWDLIGRVRPDALTLDVEMPGTDGLTFLRRLMDTHPLPVVLVSSLGRRGSATVQQALDAGALAVIAKPHADYPLARMIADLRAALHQVRGAPRADAWPNARVIAVGSSTGGTVAFEQLARGLPSDHPPVVLAQHLPPAFVHRFADRLDRVLSSRVAVAQGGERLRAGEIWVAPGTHHLRVDQAGPDLVTALLDGPLVNYHKPSVDVLFDSVARSAGRGAIGVVLTGMGSDGSRGLLAMSAAGATTLGQDQRSCAVYGMPRAAKELGAVGEELPLDQLAFRIAGILGPRARG